MDTSESGRGGFGQLRSVRAVGAGDGDGGLPVLKTVEMELELRSRGQMEQSLVLQQDTWASVPVTSRARNALQAGRGKSVQASDPWLSWGGACPGRKLPMRPQREATGCEGMEGGRGEKPALVPTCLTLSSVPLTAHSALTTGQPGGHFCSPRLPTWRPWHRAGGFQDRIASKRQQASNPVPPSSFPCDSQVQGDSSSKTAWGLVLGPQGSMDGEPGPRELVSSAPTPVALEAVGARRPSGRVGAFVGGSTGAPTGTPSWVTSTSQVSSFTGNQVTAVEMKFVLFGECGGSLPFRETWLPSFTDSLQVSLFPGRCSEFSSASSNMLLASSLMNEFHKTLNTFYACLIVMILPFKNNPLTHPGHLRCGLGLGGLGLGVLVGVLRSQGMGLYTWLPHSAPPCISLLRPPLPWGYPSTRGWYVIVLPPSATVLRIQVLLLLQTPRKFTLTHSYYGVSGLWWLSTDTFEHFFGYTFKTRGH